MPKLAMAMNEGTVNEWLVNDGDFVESGQALATIETEKVAYDVESPETGYLRILKPAGETVECGVPIGLFAADEKELSQLSTEAAANIAEQGAEELPQFAVMQDVPADSSRVRTQRIKASPLAKKMAKDRHLDLNQLTGTGPGGRIVKRDVLAAEASSAAAMPGMGSRVLASIPMQSRASIANRMQNSLQNTAQLSATWESDITRLLQVRKEFVEREQTLGTRVSFNAFLIKAMIYAIRRVPIANSTLDGDNINVHGNVNMGIAVSLPGRTEFDSDLRVAVVHNADAMGLIELDKAMKAVIERVRSGNAGADDLSGSTITLSSTAGIAPPGMHSTPILNTPNSVVLGSSTPLERPSVHDGEIAVRSQLPLSLTFDHKVLDGEPAAVFMQAINECLQTPELMLA